MNAPPESPITQPPEPQPRLQPQLTITQKNQGDGTTELLKWGGSTFATGILTAILTKTIFGGIGPQGPHTNLGWMALIVTMMCLPFGFLLLALGILKWLRNQRLRD